MSAATKNKKAVNSTGRIQMGTGGQNSIDMPQLIDLSKIRPRLLSKEKEKLYDETLSLKVSNNRVRDENRRLKTRLHVLETEH